MAHEGVELPSMEARGHRKWVISILKRIDTRFLSYQQKKKKKRKQYLWTNWWNCKSPQRCCKGDGEEVYEVWCNSPPNNKYRMVEWSTAGSGERATELDGRGSIPIDWISMLHVLLWFRYHKWHTFTRLLCGHWDPTKRPDATKDATASPHLAPSTSSWQPP